MYCIGHAVKLHISFMYEIMHVFLSKRGRAGPKGATPNAGEPCATHMKNKLVSEPWARSAAPSAHRPGRGAAFPYGGGPSTPNYCWIVAL